MTLPQTKKISKKNFTEITHLEQQIKALSTEIIPDWLLIFAITSFSFYFLIRQYENLEDTYEAFLDKYDTFQDYTDEMFKLLPTDATIYRDNTVDFYKLFLKSPVNFGIDKNTATSILKTYVSIFFPYNGHSALTETLAREGLDWIQQQTYETLVTHYAEISQNCMNYMSSRSGLFGNPLFFSQNHVMISALTNITSGFLTLVYKYTAPSFSLPAFLPVKTILTGDKDAQSIIQKLTQEKNQLAKYHRVYNVILSSFVALSFWFQGFELFPTLFLTYALFYVLSFSLNKDAYFLTYKLNRFKENIQLALSINLDNQKNLINQLHIFKGSYVQDSFIEFEPNSIKGIKPMELMFYLVEILEKNNIVIVKNSHDSLYIQCNSIINARKAHRIKDEITRMIERIQLEKKCKTQLTTLAKKINSEYFITPLSTNDNLCYCWNLPDHLALQKALKHYYGHYIQESDGLLVFKGICVLSQHDFASLMNEVKQIVDFPSPPIQERICSITPLPTEVPRAVKTLLTSQRFFSSTPKIPKPETSIQITWPSGTYNSADAHSKIRLIGKNQYALFNLTSQDLPHPSVHTALLNKFNAAHIVNKKGAEGFVKTNMFVNSPAGKVIPCRLKLKLLKTYGDYRVYSREEKMGKYTLYVFDIFEKKSHKQNKQRFRL